MAEFGKLNFAVAFNPQTAFPLDARYYFDSYDAAETAAQGAVEVGSASGTYFFGQTVVVVESSVATLYVIQPDKTLQPVGSTVLGDGKSITVVDGKVQLVGFAEAKPGQQPRIGDGGSLEWYTPDASTVEGLQQTVGQLQTDVSELQSDVGTINDTLETKANVSDVYTQTQTDEKIAAAITTLGTTQVQRVEEAGDDAVGAVSTAKDAALEAVGQAQTTATGAVSSAQTTAVQAVQDAKGTATTAISQAQAEAMKSVGDLVQQAEDAAIRQPIISDHDTWMIWDAASGQYVDTGLYAGGQAPYIGEDGYWYVGNVKTDTLAQGPAGPAGAGVPPTDTAQAGDVPTWNGEKVVWAAQSGGGGAKPIRFLNRIETTETVRSIEISEDSEGKTFEELGLTEVYGVIKTAENVSTSYPYGVLKINDIGINLGQNFETSVDYRYYTFSFTLLEDGSGIALFRDAVNTINAEKPIAYGIVVNDIETMGVVNFGNVIKKLSIRHANYGAEAFLKAGTIILVYGR